MNEIKRYVIDLERGDLLPSEIGDVCEWSAVEKLIKERDELRARALAAVWLLPEDVGVRELLELREEARAVFMGKDKQIIAKMQDELRCAHEAYRHVTRLPVPGVNMVYGMSKGGRNVKPVLMITRVQRASNGGLDIEVQLP